MTGILGKKIGMTQVFSADNKKVCVTAIEAGPCPVLAVKDKHIQLGFDAATEKRTKKPLAGYFKKLNITPRKLIREFIKEPGREYKVGEELKVDLFQIGDFVDISGISKGKGFQGGMKRWNWHGGPKTHGSTSHRRVGSMGSSTTPGRVFKGHHAPGHMGAARVTLQNLRVVKIDAQNNLILIKGAVPGCNNSYLVITKAKKKKRPETKK
ncbi:MAG: 50S ribosomal protein L3 [Candidatus Omnitrophica bacterium]|nr:50S ribosomal protein L3 [Candidatus Omnitrophota bacterium]MDD5591794.1 50S ribosomal protein L3 [Candidatus Omnitrophota bacterium]